MSATATEPPPYIGARVKRKEDAALLTGRGTYVDNMSLPGMVWLAIVRSPYAHARIKGSTSRRPAPRRASWRRSAAPISQTTGRPDFPAPGRSPRT